MGKTKYIFIILLIGFVLSNCNATDCSDNKGNLAYELLNKTLDIGNKKISIYGNFVDKKRRLLKDFYFISISNGNDKKVLISRDGKIQDSNGRIIVDLSGKEYHFYGFLLIIPNKKEFSQSKSFVVVPYFRNGESVGDSFNIYWDSEAETFKLFKIPI